MKPSFAIWGTMVFFSDEVSEVLDVYEVYEVGHLIHNINTKQYNKPKIPNTKRV